MLYKVVSQFWAGFFLLRHQEIYVIAPFVSVVKILLVLRLLYFKWKNTSLETFLMTSLWLLNKIIKNQAISFNKRKREICGLLNYLHQ